MSSPPPESREAVTALGNFVVRIAPSPDPIPLNEFFTVGVTVTGASTPVRADADVAVAVDATMPAHGHGMNTRPTVDRTGDTQHVARGLLFHMPGEWQIWVDVGPGRERARFTVQVR